MTTTNFQNFNREELFTEQDKKYIQKAIRAVYKAQIDSQKIPFNRRKDEEKGIDWQDYNSLAESLFALYDGRLCEKLQDNIMDLLYDYNEFNAINQITSIVRKIKNSLESIARAEDVVEETQVVEEEIKNIKITELEESLLHEIMSSEADGLGMGYSSFDGLEIDNETKGVLSSLIKKGLVYDSTDGCEEFEYRMYCTIPEKLIKVIGLDLSGYNLEVLSFN